MKILGLGLLHDTGIALFEDGRCVFAVNEERLNREKQSCKFPALSIKLLFDRYCSPRDIGSIALNRLFSIEKAETEYGREYTQPSAAYRLWSIVDDMGAGRHLLGSHAGAVSMARLFMHVRPSVSGQVVQSLAARGLANVPIRCFDHNHSHAAAAFYASGFEKCLVVSMDGHGDCYSARAFMCENGEMRQIASIPMYHSLAVWYQYVTLTLGFRPLRHEGKVTGLASYGKVNESLLDYLQRSINYVGPPRWLVNSSTMSGSAYRRFRRHAERIQVEDIAHTMQLHVEQVATNFVSGLIADLGSSEPVNLAVAGGLFANIKLNGCLAMLDGVKRLYVFPHMGDGGGHVGAAYLMSRDMGTSRPAPMPSMYLGPEYSRDEILRAITDTGLECVEMDDIEKACARLLANGSTVARFHGRMEFGPRALGNRSVLVSASKPGLKDTLNTQMKRSYFMPFAPALLEEDAPRMLKGYDKTGNIYKHMTVACEATPLMRELAPYAVHVDNTVRPQVVTEQDDKSFYRILVEYKKLTGHSVIINTSFNMHEEPIVCSPGDAIRSFKSAKLDCLAIGNILANSLPVAV